jgi:hypothetical protein
MDMFPGAVVTGVSRIKQVAGAELTAGYLRTKATPFGPRIRCGFDSLTVSPVSLL